MGCIVTSEDGEGNVSVTIDGVPKTVKQYESSEGTVHYVEDPTRPHCVVLKAPSSFDEYTDEGFLALSNG